MKMKPGTKKPPMGMGSVKPRMQGPISGGAGGGRAAAPAPSWMPPPPGSPGAPRLNLQPFVGGPSQGRPAMPSRGSMPLPPSAAPRPAMPSFTPPMRPGTPMGQPPAGGAGMPPPMMAGGFGPQQLQVQQAAGVFDKPQMPMGQDPRQAMMAQMQAARGGIDRMGGRPIPPGGAGMASIGQPMDRNAMMQQMQGAVGGANQMRDQWNQANPNPVMNQMPAGRPGADMGAMQSRMQQLLAARGGGGPVY